jgi:hypothetical protein
MEVKGALMRVPTERMEVGGELMNLGGERMEVSTSINEG